MSIVAHVLEKGRIWQAPALIINLPLVLRTHLCVLYIQYASTKMEQAHILWTVPFEPSPSTLVMEDNCLNATTAKENPYDVIGCSLETSKQCVASYWIFTLISPTLLLVGTAGNALIVLVMRQLHKSDFGTYMSAIAIIDILVLWTTLPRHFIRWVWLFDIRERNAWSCRVLRYVQFSLMHASAWLLVVVAVERWLSLYFPLNFHNYKQRFRKNRRVGIAIAAVSFFHFAWNLHIFWTLGPTRESACKVRFCGHPTPAIAHYWQRVHTWVDLIKLSLLPFAIMLAINVALIVRLRRRALAKQKTRSAYAPSRGEGSDCRARNLATIASEASAVATMRHLERRNASVKSPIQSDGKTAMLLSVSFFYVFMTVPTFISTALTHAKMNTPLFDSVSTMLLYSNNTFNFVVFCLSNKAFRLHFVRTLCYCATLKVCSKKNNDVNTVSDLTGNSGAAGANGYPSTPLSLTREKLPNKESTL